MGRPIGLTRAFVSWAGLGWAQPWLGLGRVGLALFGPGLAHWKACHYFIPNTCTTSSQKTPMDLLS